MASNQSPALRPDYVNEGQFVAFPLAITDETIPLPPDASLITNLAVAPNGRVVYGATCGSACHVFAAFFKGASGGVLDLGAVHGAVDVPVLRHWTAKDDRHDVLLAGANLPAGFLIIRQPVPQIRDVIQEPWYGHGGRETVFTSSSGRLLDAELLGDGRLLCLTTAGLVEVDLRDGRQRRVAETGCCAGKAARLGRVSGRCYWIDDELRIASIALDRLDRGIERGRKLPCGRPMIGWLPDHRGNLVVADDRGSIYRFSPESGEVAYVATAVLPEIQCMACLPDGRLYGLCGTGIGHFFRCDLNSGKTEALGAVATAVGGNKRYGFEFACAAVSRDGTIFFGETERGGNLWAYFPPVNANGSGTEDMAKA